jgi:glutaredoxin-related protein
MHILKENKSEVLMFYKKKCEISQKAMDLLKNKKNIIHSISYCIDENDWSELCDELKKFINNHTTTPLVFWKGAFLGGYRELKELL